MVICNIYLGAQTGGQEWNLQIIISALVVIASFGGMVWIIKLLLSMKEKMGSFSTSLEDNKKILESCPCDIHKDKIAKIEVKHDLYEEMRTSFRKLEEQLLRVTIEKDIVMRKNSPSQLTDIGREILINSGGEKCVNDNLEFFLSEVEKLNPKVALDVERDSLSALNINKENDIFNGIKNYVYQSPDSLDFQTHTGVVSVKISYELILMVMSVYLRNKYFERHTEIDITQ